MNNASKYFAVLMAAVVVGLFMFTMARRTHERQKFEQLSSETNRLLTVGVSSPVPKPAANDPKTRADLAWELEREMLDGGFDAHITASGSNNEVLTLKHVLVNRPLVYKLAKAGFVSKLKNAGFKKVVFTDGYDFKIEQDVY